MKQKQALDILKSGESVFLTGPAGSGKTFLLTQYIKYLRDNNIAVAVTASTGIAATHLGGRTIHSWCGMGIEDELLIDKINALKKKNYLFRSVAFTKVLIIDEISMLNAKQLDLIDWICRTFKEDMRPFGGMQVVFCGDFFQLPPVKRGGKDGRFVTESHIWNNMDIRVCYLEEQHRQSDKKFLQLLGDIRKNEVTEKTIKILEKRLGKTVKSEIKPTKLHTHNIDVEDYNFQELDKLKTKEISYEMEAEGVDNLVERLRKGYCLAPQNLTLKIGAVVMFVKNNFNKGFVNGTLGKVVDFDEENDNYPVVRTFDGNLITAYPEQWVVEDGKEVIASVRQVPLRLAWAITVHKSQGMSLDAAEIDLRKTFEFGMGYVALSRVRSLAGMSLVGFNEMALRAKEEVIILDRELLAKSEEDEKDYLKMDKKNLVKTQKDFLEKNGGEKYVGGLFG
ncbi:MAG: PIF1 family DEAD/DEAH box helicase [Candidatus Pacebacteria bacterium]|nr:PIF1 family DEAD/DEAH box helicase [Candidatus Paceibacterota bacterium]